MKAFFLSFLIIIGIFVSCRASRSGFHKDAGMKCFLAYYIDTYIKIVMIYGDI